ncbi:E3 ubiquitin-protein ligase TRIM21-like isoform X1 [Micropterus dolomieu]|uniref:E3 ubiquitin-protein ligase TRIM21-like isoform X1 n=1 Tax=Micropterus dolomieu TaxID=147949 RepID=UPI001E8E133A|nr:E3 ubiquitin-protein ligase TRIM21-like isoform X1 [Micropterus dolomieu]
MAAVSCLLSEDQFLCSICQDVFTDPVSTPCGHNFCKNCISTHWKTNDRYQCPLCKEVFHIRPELHINTFISEMVSQFKSAQQEASSSSKSSSSDQQESNPGEVPCDVCTGTKLKALKSCLVCLVSYCETHLEPHLTASGLKRHQLIDPVENLEARMCTKHDKPLELFCKTDQTCVCMLCPVLDHKMHDVVPLKEGYEGKKAELGKTEAEIQQMIQKRRLKIQQIKHSVGVSEEDADKAKAEGVEIFTSLKEFERGLKELIDTIEEKQRTTEQQAEGFIKELEQEISELIKRRTEVEQLSRSEDHLHLLQSVQSLNIHPPPTKDWTKVRVHLSYEWIVLRAVNQLEDKLSKEMKQLVKAELERVQQYVVNVTLDPDTAYPYLTLSENGKEVNCDGVCKFPPNNPKRFTRCRIVLGKQSFSSGRFYFKVHVKGKTKWTLGVARESINRKGQIKLSPVNGYWTVGLRNGNEYKAYSGPSVRLSLKSRPQKVGVFVDYEEGLVSFYDVDAAALIYSFTGCCFTDKLFPCLSPCLDDGGENAAPLIISPAKVYQRFQLFPLERSGSSRGEAKSFLRA